MTIAVWWWLHPDYMAVSQVILGALGLVAAVCAVLYAVKVAREQFRLIEEQGTVLDRQLVLLGEHKELLVRIQRVEAEQAVQLRRQREIVELQYGAMKREWAMHARLVVLASYSIADEHEFVRISLNNFGVVPLEGFHWDLWIPLRPFDVEVRSDPQGGAVAFTDPGSESSADGLPKDYYVLYSGHSDVTLPPGGSIEFVWIRVNGDPPLGRGPMKYSVDVCAGGQSVREIAELQPYWWGTALRQLRENNLRPNWRMPKEEFSAGRTNRTDPHADPPAPA